MLKDFYCAYHHNKIISEFCRCSSCLLPVCSTCLSLHTQEHTSVLHTQPQYASLSAIYASIDSELVELAAAKDRMYSRMEDIEALRKDRQDSVRQDIVAYRYVCLHVGRNSSATSSRPSSVSKSASSPRSARPIRTSSRNCSSSTTGWSTWSRPSSQSGRNCPARRGH